MKKTSKRARGKGVEKKRGATHAKRGEDLEIFADFDMVSGSPVPTKLSIKIGKSKMGLDKEHVRRLMDVFNGAEGQIEHYKECRYAPYKITRFSSDKASHFAVSDPAEEGEVEVYEKGSNCTPCVIPRLA